MPKNEAVRNLRRNKRDLQQDRRPTKKHSSPVSLPELQKDKTSVGSAEVQTASKEFHDAGDRTHPVQQNDADRNNEGATSFMETYQKLKCVYCGYELASKAKRPKCYKCGRRRFNKISEFSVIKNYNLKGGVNMAKETEAKKSEEEKKEVQTEEADELDTLID